MVYGKISETRRKRTPVTRATFLSLFSSVFLLQYSLPPAIPPIPNPKPPFGDISKTEATKAIHARTSTIIKRVCIFYNNKNKVVILYISSLKIQLEYKKTYNHHFSWFYSYLCCSKWFQIIKIYDFLRLLGTICQH